MSHHVLAKAETKSIIATSHNPRGFGLDTLLLAVTVVAINLAIIRFSLLAGFLTFLVILPAAVASGRFVRRLQNIGDRVGIRDKIVILLLHIASTAGMCLVIIVVAVAVAWPTYALCLMNGLAKDLPLLIGFGLAIPAALLAGLSCGYAQERFRRRYINLRKLRVASRISRPSELDSGYNPRE